MAHKSSPDHLSIKQKYYKTLPYQPLFAQLEDARNWCECLLRHDADSVCLSPHVFRQHLRALAEAIETAYQISTDLSGAESIVPFKQGERT